MSNKTKKYSASKNNSVIPGRILSYFRQHLNALNICLKTLLATPIITLATLIAITIVMLLPTSLLIATKNTQLLRYHWNTTVQLALFLKKELAANQIQFLLDDLKKMPEIATLSFISPQQGLEEFSKFNNAEKILSEIRDNPLPPVVILKPILLSEPKFYQLLERLKNRSEVELTQFDMQSIKHLFNLFDFMEDLFEMVSTCLVVVVLIIMGNYIRLISQDYQKEIPAYRHLGASSAFLRRPFLYIGTLLGLICGLFTLLFIDLILKPLANPIFQLAYSNQTDLLSPNFTTNHVSSLLFFSALLGWMIGFIIAMITTRKI